MIPAERGYRRAPIRYEELGAALNTMRALAGLAAMVTFAVVWWRTGYMAAPMLIGSAIIAVDGLRRRHHGSSALPPLLIDVTLGWSGLLVWGNAPASQVASFLYFLTAALLLLPRTSALLVALYAAGAQLVVTVVAPHGLLPGPGRTAGALLWTDVVVAGIYTTVVVVVLYGAVRSLLRAQDHQQEALEAERRAVALKNEFVSMVSHELRTPLTGIAGFTEALRESWRSLPPEEVEEFLSIMRRETDHLADLVEDILVIPRLEAGQLRLEPRAVNVAEVSAEVCETILKGEKEYSIELPGDVDVVADPVRLRQILRNLVENARKYGGDQILIEGELAPQGMYMIIVNDNGKGVPKEATERIFEHFEQLSKGDARLQQGVGLGLPIARKLARAMGGELWYEARFPVGSRFCFTVRRVGSASVDADVGADQESVGA